MHCQDPALSAKALLNLSMAMSKSEELKPEWIWVLKATRNVQLTVKSSNGSKVDKLSLLRILVILNSNAASHK